MNYSIKKYRLKNILFGGGSLEDMKYLNDFIDDNYKKIIDTEIEQVMGYRNLKDITDFLKANHVISDENKFKTDLQKATVAKIIVNASDNGIQNDLIQKYDNKNFIYYEPFSKLNDLDETFTMAINSEENCDDLILFTVKF